ncbi:MAG: 50S ribosomal protein L13e [Pyrodictiaceae archaeon]
MQPRATVKKPRLLKHGIIDLGVRMGKGFSISELEEVGLSLEDAKRIGLPIDARRRSKWEWNVRALKTFLEKLGLRRQD